MNNEKCRDCDYVRLIKTLANDGEYNEQINAIMVKMEELDDIYNAFVFEMDLQTHELNGIISKLITKEKINERD
jgi:hypothetical protein